MDVTVYQLTDPLALADFHPYGDPAGATTLPAGTYWIPMAQAQKHWIQAMLNEEPWIPFDVTYDVTAWSNPLLMNLDGGWTGEAVSAAPSTVVPPVAAAGLADACRPTVPSVGLFEIPNSTRGFEAAGQTQLPLPRGLAPAVHATSPPTTSRPGLAGIDVLVMPDGYANYGVQALGAKGKQALRDWVNAGGRIVAWQGGAVVAAKAGVSTREVRRSPHERARDAHPRVASTMRARSRERHRRPGDWVMYQDDMTMQPGLGDGGRDVPRARATRTTRRPASRSGRHARRDRPRSSTRRSAPDGSSRSRSTRTSGPGRRARSGCCGTRSSGPEPAGFGHAALAAGSKARAAAEKAAVAAADRLPDARVGHPDPGRRARMRRRRPRSWQPPRRRGRPAVDVGGDALFLVANRDDLSFEEHPFFGLDRPRPREGRHHAAGGQPAVGRAARRDGAIAGDRDHPGAGPALTVLALSSARLARVHTFYASDRPLREAQPEAARLDAQEIKTAVAHQDAARAAAEAPFVNLRRPGPGARARTADPPSAGARRSARTCPTSSGTTGAGSSRTGSTTSTRSSRS